LFSSGNYLSYFLFHPLKVCRIGFWCKCKMLACAFFWDPFSVSPTSNLSMGIISSPLWKPCLILPQVKTMAMCSFYFALLNKKENSILILFQV
jgi:hypothetical protein